MCSTARAHACTPCVRRPGQACTSRFGMRMVLHVALARPLGRALLLLLRLPAELPFLGFQQRVKHLWCRKSSCISVKSQVREKTTKTVGQAVTTAAVRCHSVWMARTTQMYNCWVRVGWVVRGASLITETCVRVCVLKLGGDSLLIIRPSLQQGTSIPSYHRLSGCSIN